MGRFQGLCPSLPHFVRWSVEQGLVFDAGWLFRTMLLTSDCLVFVPMRACVMMRDCAFELTAVAPIFLPFVV